MQICRAEDGQVFQVNMTLYDIAKKPNTLRPLLSSLTSIDPASIIMFLSDGQQLREDNLRELSGVQDQSIFVFNRDYLDLDVEEVMNVLGVREGEGLIPSQLQEDSISSLHTSQILQDNLSRANQHQSYVSALLQQIHNQHEALLIASSNLDMHVLTLTEAWAALKDNIASGLESQARLLEGIDYDLDAINQLSVHPEFLAKNTKPPVTPATPNTEEGTSAEQKVKMLGEYVSRPKMKLVVDQCRRTHLDLVTRYQNSQLSMEDLTRGANEVRENIHSDGKLSEASQCTKLSLDDTERMSALISAWNESEDPTDDESEALMAEIKALDNSLRQEVVTIGEIKNRHTRHLLVALRNISTLQSSIFSLPTMLSSLDSDLRSKGGFAHLQRLHGMAFAYGASVVEVVRRREFGKFFLQRAQAVAEIMAKFSASERKRRQVYRGESLSQLPFEIKGMDLAAPSLELSTVGTEEGPYDIGREDVEFMLEAMRQIEDETPLHVPLNSSDTAPHHPIRQTREALEKLVAKMDSLESDFDKIAEKSILSNTRLAYYKRRTLNEASAYNEAAEQLRELQDQQAAQEQTFANERRSLQNQIRELDAQKQHLNSQLPHLESTIDHLEELLQQARTNVETTHTKYEQSHSKNEMYEQDLRQRNSEISKLLDQLQQDENARQLLEMEKAELQETLRDRNERMELVNSELLRHVDRITTLDKDVNLMSEENRLLVDRDEENNRRIEELEKQLRSAREEGSEAKVHLKDTLRERDRLLRDHQVEADGDRAVLEHQFSETRTQLETSRLLIQDLQQKLNASTSQVKSLQSQNSILQKDLSSLREELHRTSQELATSTQTENSAHLRENTLRAELNFANNALVQVEGKMERNERLLAQVFDVAIAFRNSQARAMAQAQIMMRPIAPKASLGANTGTGGALGESTTLLQPSSIGIELGTSPRAPQGLPERPLSPPPIDPTDPLTALDTLREFDLDAFSETIAKTGTTIRKWQKQCKEYRERAKGKISFRNFQKGDLALFLPTRNSVARPWAAFNMSFPHYFLNATGHVAEQLKTREWIVARITSITERVVDTKDPNSNPYGLGNGVKYYILEVEDWTLNTPAASVRPKQTRNVSSTTSMPMRPPLGPIESWRDSTIMSQSTSLPPLQSKQEEDPDILEGITAMPARPRAATASSAGAGPSSLSRLLAQAQKDPSPTDRLITSSPPKISSPPITIVKETLPDAPTLLTPATEGPPSPKPSSAPKEEEINGKPIATPPSTSDAPKPLASPKAQASPRLPKNSPKPSPRQRPVSLMVAGSSPLTSTSNVNVKGSTAIAIAGARQRNSSVRSSMSSTRPSSVPRRPPFALSSSPTKAPPTTSLADVLTSSSQDFNSPFRISSEDLERNGTIEEHEQETPSPADSATEGMNSVLWSHARRRTTSTITPATAALSHSVNRNQPIAPSPLSGVSNVWSSWTGWRRKRPESMIASDSDTRRSSTPQHRPTASESGAAGLLKRFEPRE